MSDTPPEPKPAAAAVQQARNPLHGVTLERIVNALVECYGWPGLAERVPVRCFAQDPSVKSSLTFLRRTPWAREKVESLYLYMLREQQRRKPKVATLLQPMPPAPKDGRTA
jgi:uncharacterized protein (DUF2132 family)